MPIDCSIATIPIDQERFHTIDRQVMGEAFAIHNSMGRFFDEGIYQSELAARCRNLGIDVQREVEIRVSHGDFNKSYFLDLLLDRGCVYELKTTVSLSPAHSRQLIHYLLLMDLNHGKLVNFRSGSVESRFVSTRLGSADRKSFQVDDRGWQDSHPRLRTLLLQLLDDWGAFLEADIYREALTSLIDSPHHGVQSVPVSTNGRIVGHQKLCMLDSQCAWHLSAIHQHLGSYETHIRRLLAHTPLASIHWINLNQRRVTLRTLSR